MGEMKAGCQALQTEGPYMLSTLVLMIQSFLKNLKNQIVFVEGLPCDFCLSLLQQQKNKIN